MRSSQHCEDVGERDNTLWRGETVVHLYPVKPILLRTEHSVGYGASDERLDSATGMCLRRRLPLDDPRVPSPCWLDGVHVSSRPGLQATLLTTLASWEHRIPTPPPTSNKISPGPDPHLAIGKCSNPRLHPTRRCSVPSRATAVVTWKRNSPSQPSPRPSTTRITP